MRFDSIRHRRFDCEPPNIRGIAVRHNLFFSKSTMDEGGNDDDVHVHDHGRVFRRVACSGVLCLAIAQWASN